LFVEQKGSLSIFREKMPSLIVVFRHQYSLKSYQTFRYYV